MLRGRCHLPWPRAGALQVPGLHPGVGGAAFGAPQQAGAAGQGTQPATELGAALNPGWVWEGGTGKGEEEKGARSQQNIILGYILSPWQLLGNLTGSELPSTK